MKRERAVGNKKREKRKEEVAFVLFWPLLF
jgi:hypothetical protein